MRFNKKITHKKKRKREKSDGSLNDFNCESRGEFKLIFVWLSQLISFWLLKTDSIAAPEFTSNCWNQNCFWFLWSLCFFSHGMWCHKNTREREKKTEKTHWEMCYRSRLIKKWFVCSELHLLFVELVFQLVFAFSTFCIIRWAKNDFVVDQMFELHAF